MLALLRTRRFAPLFWTQLLGAFNDNLFKSALVVALTFGTFRRGDAPEGLLVNLATALLVLPFFLFGSLAGQLADRFDKARLARALKLAEVGAMALALVGFWCGSVPTLFVALFLMERRARSSDPSSTRSCRSTFAKGSSWGAMRSSRRAPSSRSSVGRSRARC